MKIETLPLLSSDFAEWTWAESNGIAQDSSTRISYFALVNKDLCSRFVGEVWNDLVRMLNNALTCAGIQWDTTYGDVTDVLLDTSIRANREFKAFMFNAVVLNINQFGFIHWNWERTNNMPGFLGRTYMRGYSKYGKDADFIYGWYILELAEKLNVLIHVLKNEGPFGEYEGLLPVTAVVPAEIFSTKSGILLYQDKSEVYINAPLAWAYVIESKSQKKVLSYAAGKIINRFPQKINASKVSFADVNSKVALAKRKDVLGNGLGETFSGSELTGMIFVQRLLYILEIRTKYTTGFAVPYSLKLISAECVSSGELAKMECVPHISWLETEKNRKSYSVVDLMLAERVLMLAATKMDSYSISEIILRGTLLMDSVQHSKSFSEGSMEYKRAQYMQRLIKASSDQNSDIEIKISEPMKKSEGARSYYEASAVARAIKALENNMESTSGYIGVLYPALEKALDFLGEQEKTYVSGSVRAIQGLLIAVRIKSGGYAYCEIADGIPKLMEESVCAKEYDVSELKTIQGEVVEFKDNSYSLHEAKLAEGLSKGLEGKYKSSTVAVCTMEFECTKETWYDPVQNGTDLYIRNAYPQWQEDSNVHLDGGIYYEPKQTETNVYIRSAESLKGV